MLTLRVALIDKTGKIDFTELSAVAAAINVQATRDLAPLWGVSAMVQALPSPKHIPVGICPVFIVDNLPPTEGGVHLTKKNHQPYALVERGNGWSVAASHECMEMIVDPSGNRLHASNAIEIKNGKIVDAVGKFEYVVEVCDPSEDDPFGYTIDGVLVSDFYTPHYFDPVAASGVRYSFTGAITRPRDVLPNGYLSWIDPASEEIQQLKYFGGSPQIVNLGSATGASLREFIDGKSRTTSLLSNRAETEPKLAAAKARKQALAAFAEARARRY
jgi:hypothetical protein